MLGLGPASFSTSEQQPDQDWLQLHCTQLTFPRELTKYFSFPSALLVLLCFPMPWQRCLPVLVGGKVLLLQGSFGADWHRKLPRLVTQGSWKKMMRYVIFLVVCHVSPFSLLSFRAVLVIYLVICTVLWMHFTLPLI